MRWWGREEDSARLEKEGVWVEERLHSKTKIINVEFVS